MGQGEDAFVARLLAQLPPAGRSDGVYTGAGADDCAVVRSLPKTHRQLLKTDCVIEGVHFLPDSPPGWIGWKALCRPLSDLAASGGRPRHALVTFGLSRDRTPEWAVQVYAGLGRAAKTYGVAVVGGDTASTPGPSFLSVCLTGSVRRDRCVTRGGGKPGDVLYVTGELGGSFPSGKHLRFEPRLAEGRWLTRHFPVSAMMDLSDGLAADLPRLARTSGTGFRLDSERLARTAGCTVAEAMGDGEDYELLFALPAHAARHLERAWRRKFPELALTAIGTLEPPTVSIGLDQANGFDHFPDIARSHHGAP